MVRPSTSVRFSAGPSENADDGTESAFWRARQDCWRPDVRDVEKISWGMPAKKKGTGSRGIPHRLNQDERRSFDQARHQGFLQVHGSSYRSQRRDAPLLNSYRSLMDARGRPMVVLHKINPNSAGGTINGDRLVVDLSPLRLPEEFQTVERELRERVFGELELEMEMEGQIDTDNTYESREKDEGGEEMSDETIVDVGTTGDAWETRPLYQLPPYFLTWEVSRQQGKQLGKILAEWFDTVDVKAASSKKPKGVKPGKGRKSGGYGIG